VLLRYKQYSAQYTWAPMPGLYVAELIETSEVVSFSATTLEELKWLMMVTVEKYLCQFRQSFAVTF
jgi:predicted HicB family RNase H-like nuclease